jgi:alpha-ketoglutarate-dependent taurine dioxygenase
MAQTDGDLPTSQRATLRRLSPALGVEVTSFDFETLDSQTANAFLTGALLDHQLLLVRGLNIDTQTFRRIGLRFGPLREVPGGMLREAGTCDVERKGIVPDPYATKWHTDGTTGRAPVRFTLLYALRVPSDGGETEFADMYAACAALSPAHRQALAERVAVHDTDVARHLRHGAPVARPGMSVRGKFRKRVEFVRRLFSPQAARHPVIRVHEETGRAALFLGDHAWRVTGYWWPVGMRLVDELNAFATSRPEWIYKHSWRAGDLLIWDNRCLLHRAPAYDTDARERIMLRAVVEA